MKRILLLATLGLLVFSFANASADTSFLANSLIIPMDSTGNKYQDNGIFEAYGLVYYLLQNGVPVNWCIKDPKNWGDVDFTATGVDIQSGSTITNYGYTGGPFVIDSSYYAQALALVQKFQASHPNGDNISVSVAVHRATQSFTAPVSFVIRNAPNLAVFSDGNEKIAFRYLNASAIPQNLRSPGRNGNTVTAKSPVSSKPSVTSAAAGNNTISGTSTEANGTVIAVFVDGIYVGTTTVSGGAWSLGPKGIPPGINVTATATAPGEGTSQISSNKASGNLPAGGTSSAPTITNPIRRGARRVKGTSTEANGTVIKVYRNGVQENTTTVASGKWSLLLSTEALGNDVWDATATAPSKTESGISNFVWTVPVTASVTAYAIGSNKSVSGTYFMADGSPIDVYVTRSGSDIYLGTAYVNNGSWSLSGLTIAADDLLWAKVERFPFPNDNGTYTCPGTMCAPDVPGETQVAGATSTSHHDGALFDENGLPQYCQLMSMHYTVSTSTTQAEVVAESRAFLNYPVHLFAECQAVNAFENNTNGHFLSTLGFDTKAQPSSVDFYNAKSPFVQGDGTFGTRGGSEPAYGLKALSSYYSPGVVNITGHGSAIGTQDVWMNGYIDGNTSKGKVSYLGAHEYTTDLPLSTNPTSQGVRMFLNSLFEAPCASDGGTNPATSVNGTTPTNVASYTVTVNYSNPGAVLASDALLYLDLPAGVTFVSASGGGTLSGSSVVWDLGTLNVGASGSFTVNVTLSAEGTYSFISRLLYTVGINDQQATSSPLNVVFDTTAPGPPTIITPANGSRTTDTTPALTGTAEANSTVQLTITGPGGPYIITTTADGSGNFSVDSSVLPVGAFSVSATATDGAGNVSSPSASNAFNVVWPAPVVNSPILATPASITGTASAPNGTTITVFKNGVALGTTTVSSGAWTYSGAGLSGLAGGESITAKAGTGDGQSDASNTVVVTPLPPVVDSPIAAGATSVSGTSSAPDGSTITVYKNGVSIGTTTVSGGVWTLGSIAPLSNGDQIKATVTASGQTSVDSNVVTVLAQSLPPIVSSPLLAGASVTITGSSVEAPGSTITVYLNGIAIGTTSVQADGTWALPNVPLSDGQVVTATVLAPGKGVSNVSNSVTVSGNAADISPSPLITSPVPAGSTSVSGTGDPGSAVALFGDGQYLGVAIVDGFGNWTIGGLQALISGTYLSANETLAPKGTSAWSPPVIVGNIVDLLRSDILTSPGQPIAANFVWAYVQDPAMDPLGNNHVTNWGEGALQQLPGSSDDDKAYLHDVHSGDTDPDPSVLSDTNRVLVFYQLVDNHSKILKLTKVDQGGGVFAIQFNITP